MPWVQPILKPVMQFSTRLVTVLIASCSVRAGAQTPPSAPDWIIIPGIRVGPILRSTSLNGIRRLFTRSDVALTEMSFGIFSLPGATVYGSRPTRSLEAVTGPTGKIAYVTICRKSSDRGCEWHTPSGITLGLTLNELETRNGKPFKLSRLGADDRGEVLSWDGGRLEKELEVTGGGRLVVRVYPSYKDGHWFPRLSPAEAEQIDGEGEVWSNHPLLQKLNPVVRNLRQEFERQGLSRSR
jgi:hypothetical protein